MKKTVSLVLALVMCVMIFSSCGAKTAPETTATAPQSTVAAKKAAVNIAVLKGPTGMGSAKLMDMDEAGTAKNDYTFTIATAPDQITAKLVSGELDIASIPTNAVSALYNKTKGGVTLVAVNTLGVLYILEKGDSVNSVADLKGKKILASGKGSTAEYVLNYILEKNNLTVGEDVTVDYAAEHAEAASKALAGDYDIVMLPEPFVTSTMLNDSEFKVKINLTEEWEKLGGGALTMGAVAVRTAFLKDNEQAVKDFLAEYKESVDFTNNSIDDAAALIEKYDIAKAAVAKKAIPNCNIVMITGETMKADAANFLTVISETDATAIGGKLPADDFYYTAS